MSWDAEHLHLEVIALFWPLSGGWAQSRLAEALWAALPEGQRSAPAPSQHSQASSIERRMPQGSNAQSVLGEKIWNDLTERETAASAVKSR